MTKSRKTKERVILALVCLVLWAFCRYENRHLLITEYRCESEKISAKLDGFRIVQISDFHNSTFGKNNSTILEKIRSCNPDIMVITGDFVDKSRTNIKISLSFAEEAVKICPVYYVTGNHEKSLSSDKQNELLSGLKDVGVKVLENEVVKISREEVSQGDAFFTLLGLDDSSLRDDTLNRLMEGHEDEYSLVLAHEPQLLKNYAKTKCDLVLSGHAHGGQFRLPIMGGFIAPDQGLNPKYTEGEYYEDSTKMIVSRGIGNSVVPLRLFNLPEIVCVELKSTQ